MMSLFFWWSVHVGLVNKIMNTIAESTSSMNTVKQETVISTYKP